MLQVVIEHDPQPPFESAWFEEPDRDSRDRATARFVPAASR
jgi:hypothetical protein